MRSVGELADDYERWAAENEVFASKIMTNVHVFPGHGRDEQLRRASVLTKEAELFRQHAARLRSSAVERVAMLLHSQKHTAAAPNCSIR